MEFYLSAYQCYRMRQYRTPSKLIMEMPEHTEVPPFCPPTRLGLKVLRGSDSKPLVSNPPATAPVKGTPNIKLKIPPNCGLQLVQQAIGK